ncbi:MAG: dihydroorotate dehydrogenase (quinone) [Betaproteobacteria bacterium]
MSLYGLARALLFALDPETAHRLTLGLLEFSPFSSSLVRPVRAMGIDFPNPVGLAAGLDKHAEHVDALARLGFGFLELGGVTPRPQPGNPRPRLFRIAERQAIINRYGLNSIGVEAFAENLRRARSSAVIGVNVGKNKDTPNEDAIGDYERCLEVLYPLVHYVTINVSSPNTKGLRDLQSEAVLMSLLRTISFKRDRLRDQHGRDVALAVKIAPDLDDFGLQAVADVARKTGMDGVVAANTTVSREALKGLRHADEEGGVSGAPLTSKAVQVVRSLVAKLGGEIPVIGVGGIMSGAHAAAMFAAGATLVQIMSGLVYRGPGLISECVSAYPAK